MIKLKRQRFSSFKKVVLTSSLAIPLILCSWVSEVKAQDVAVQTQKRFDVGLEGMIGAAVGRNFYAFNVGGPSFRLRITPNLKVGLGALPSLYLKEGKLGGKLGVSPRVDIGHIVLFAPFFHFDTSDVWIGSFGMGYNFGH